MLPKRWATLRPPTGISNNPEGSQPDLSKKNAYENQFAQCAAGR